MPSSFCQNVLHWSWFPPVITTGIRRRTRPKGRHAEAGAGTTRL
jgi:hypothetical protein